MYMLMFIRVAFLCFRCCALRVCCASFGICVDLCLCCGDFVWISCIKIQRTACASSFIRPSRPVNTQQLPDDASGATHAADPHTYVYLYRDWDHGGLGRDVSHSVFACVRLCVSVCVCVGVCPSARIRTRNRRIFIVLFAALVHCGAASSRGSSCVSLD